MATSQEAVPIQPEERIEEVLAAGEVHTFEVELVAGDFLFGSVDESGCNVVIQVSEPNGELLAAFNAPAHLPELHDFGVSLTLRHLLHHTSGLRDQWTLMHMAGWRFDDVISQEQLLEMILRQRELNFPPGERFMYCNSGYTLLAEVVARTAGMSFAEFMRTRVFEQLGMQNTHIHTDHQALVPGLLFERH